MHSRPLAALVLAALTTFVTAPAHADATPENRQDPAIVRLAAAKGASLKWTEARPGSSARYGHGEVLVNAPLAAVKTAAVDFAHYKDLHKKLATARVVAKNGDTVDLYVKLPVKLGPVEIEQWQVIRFAAPRADGEAGFVLEGRGVQGNMKEGHVVVSARAVDERRTVLKVDLLLQSRLPAPQSLVDEELRDGALDIAAGLRARAQGNGAVVTSL